MLAAEFPRVMGGNADDRNAESDQSDHHDKALI